MTADSGWRPDEDAAGAPPPHGDTGAALQAALRRRDALACRRYAEIAGGNMDRAAVADLCALLRVARRRRSARGRRRDWVWARIAAVNALGRIGDPDGVPALTDALFDPDPAVREAAAFVLPGYGDQALRPLIRALRRRPDWELQSMQLLLTTLGALGNRRATPALLQALQGQLPIDPSRWARWTFVQPFKLVSAFMLAWWAVMLLQGLPIGEPSWQGLLEALLALLIRSFVPFLFVYMVSVCLVSVPMLNRVATNEREELVIAALQSLAALADKRAVPAIAGLTVNANARVGHSALLTLQALLPLVSAADDERFPAQARRQLAAALESASSQQPDAALEIVRALEHVGDGQAVEAVERAAQRGATPRLRREAARVLPILRVRRQRERASAHLLRAATSPDVPAEELLRAAEAVEDAQADELLRMPDDEQAE